MLFHKKYDRAMELMKEKRLESEENLKGTNEDIELEKYDRLAMLISAFLVFLPTAILILGFFGLITWLISLA